MTEFAILDTETTGLGASDRIVEIALVTYDAERRKVVDEFDTLVNPMRDIGPTNIHGLTPSMVSAAPTFAEIAPSLAERLDGAVLVAHNLSFDVRMLIQEFDRAGGLLEPGTGICTLRLTGESLGSACRTYGVDLTHHHRALTDARASLGLLELFLDDDIDGLPAEVFGIDGEINPRTLRRDHLDPRAFALPVTRAPRGSRYPTSDSAVLSYLDALDWALDDLILDESERSEMRALADALGLDRQSVQRAHRSYFNLLVQGAQRDGIITSSEHEVLVRVADLLDLHEVDVPEVNDFRAAPSEIPVGSRVCFTGTAVIDGEAVARYEIEESAALAGLQPVGGVTKQCDLLVCADVSSMSSKTRKARAYGIPIMSFDEFVQALGFVEQS